MPNYTSFQFVVKIQIVEEHMMSTNNLPPSKRIKITFSLKIDNANKNR